jgi:heterodisulfide reductase subunit A
VGVFAAGAFGEPKDISESIMQAGAASEAAARMIKIYDVLGQAPPPPEPEYPDVSREPAKTMIAVCTSCPTLGSNVDLEELTRTVARVHSVCDVVSVQQACTEQGWQQIRERAQAEHPNRILLGACMPYAYIPRLKELGRTVGLNPALMDVVDVHTPTFNGRDRVDVAREIFSSLSMAVAKLQGADPTPPPVMVDVSRSALVVGGGLAGLTAAMAIADQGFGVCLVESEEELGGMAMRLHTQLDGTDPRKYMEDLVAQVEKHPQIKVFKDARVVLSRGSAGRFRSAISNDGGIFPLEHGVTILATGGQEAKIYESGFCVHKSVMTHFGLEEKLATGALDVGGLKAVAMIQCWRSRKEGERNYCSRICCPEMLKNVLTMKERNPDLPIYVFYRDIMAQGFLETYYTQARKAGVIFIRYDLENPPQVSFTDGKPVITALDPVLGAQIRIEADILSLSSGIEPNDVEDLVEIFGVETDHNGFFQEADSKWRPVEFMKQGIYLCGLAHSPRRMSETVASAKAAAQRALRILAAGKVARENVVPRCGRLCAPSARPASRPAPSGRAAWTWTTRSSASTKCSARAAEPARPCVPTAPRS